MSTTSEPLTPEMEKDIRDWLATQDALYTAGGVWHGRKQEAHHIRLAAAVVEIDRLRQRVTNLEDIETDDQDEIDRLRSENVDRIAELQRCYETIYAHGQLGRAQDAEIDRLREELATAEQENAEVRAGAERECNRYRRTLLDINNIIGKIARAALDGKP